MADFVASSLPPALSAATPDSTIAKDVPVPPASVAVTKYQRVWDTVNLGWCYFFKSVDDPTPAMGETSPTNSGSISSHNIVSVRSFFQPAFLTPPTISGAYFVGETLICAPGTWGGFPVPTLSYQWRRNGVDIAGATAAAYGVVIADYVDGTTVTCRVTLSNSAGSVSVASNPLSGSFETLLAPLGVRVWLDAHGGTYLTLSGANIDSAIDRSGGGNSAASTGSARPTYNASAFGGRGGMAFAGAQGLATPSFTAAPSTSGSLYWHPTVDDSCAVGFGGFVTHLTILAVSGGMYALAPGTTSCGAPAVSLAVPHRVTWRTVAGGASRVIVDGVVYTSTGTNTATSQTGRLSIGAARVLPSPPFFYVATATIGEIVFADAVWTDAEMGAVDAAMAVRWP